MQTPSYTSSTDAMITTTACIDIFAINVQYNNIRMKLFGVCKISGVLLMESDLLWYPAFNS